MVVKGNRASPMFVTGINDNKKFFEDENHIRFLDAEDCYYGQVTRSINNDEIFELIEGDERFKVLQTIIKQLTSTNMSIEDSISMIQIALFGDRKSGDFSIKLWDKKDG